MPKDALIGYTGFVGSNLLARRNFKALYNSKNIEEIKNQSFKFVVCAGAPGTKWLANKNPEQDLASVKRLMDSLKKITCGKFVLISTVDVYPKPTGVDEDSPIEKEKLAPYGKHRKILEEFARENFNALIIRLPGLFGPGLKKNVIYDLIHKKEIQLNGRSLLQFYSAERLNADIEKALNNNLSTLNICSEPVVLKEVAETVFGVRIKNNQKSTANYNIKTKHAKLWGMDMPYLYTKKQTLKDLKTFAENEIPLSS